VAAAVGVGAVATTLIAGGIGGGAAALDTYATHDYDASTISKTELAVNATVGAAFAGVPAFRQAASARVIPSVANTVKPGASLTNSTTASSMKTPMPYKPTPTDVSGIGKGGARGLNMKAAANNVSQEKVVTTNPMHNVSLGGTAAVKVTQGNVVRVPANTPSLTPITHKATGTHGTALMTNAMGSRPNLTVIPGGLGAVKSPHSAWSDLTRTRSVVMNSGGMSSVGTTRVGVTSTASATAASSASKTATSATAATTNASKKTTSAATPASKASYADATLGGEMLVPSTEILLLESLNARKLPGIAHASKSLAHEPKLLRGTHGNAGNVPAEIGAMLEGKQFRDFDHFRTEFWAAVSKSSYASEFGASNLLRMKDGLAAFAVENQHVIGKKGVVKTYQLHHKLPIQHGGSTYDLSNIAIVTPKFHSEVLKKSYHYGKDK
jgi:hypothetical protein